MIVFFFGLFFGVVFGVAFFFLIRHWIKNSRLLSARQKAEEILKDAEERAESIREESKLVVEETSSHLWGSSEEEILELEGRVALLAEDYHREKRRRSEKLEFQHKNWQRARSRSDRKVSDFKQAEQQFQILERHVVDLRNRVAEVMANRLNLALEDFRQNQVKDAIDSTKHEIIRLKKIWEENSRQMAEKMARKILSNIHNRFQRAAITERGVGVIALSDERRLKKVCGADGEWLKTLSELAEVEINVSESGVLQVMSFDPVRRRLATRVLEKMARERRPFNRDRLMGLYEKTKTEVWRKVESDGEAVARELQSSSLHIEIKRMLGVLRYRYSFTQNQYFHVAEVGWICRLMASELGAVDPQTAGRAGLLHDVGKAMDHALEGGHAVIGADFIAEYGEAEDVVYAVRAHHYEVQPKALMDFLVIGADAVSGARPGARRATLALYNQKIETLTQVVESFKQVTKSYIVNAGREIRAFVDSSKVSDQGSLQLCAEISKKIESECQYPGQIKVVLIREKAVEAYAK